MQPRYRYSVLGVLPSTQSHRLSPQLNPGWMGGRGILRQPSAFRLSRQSSYVAAVGYQSSFWYSAGCFASPIPTMHCVLLTLLSTTPPKYSLYTRYRVYDSQYIYPYPLYNVQYIVQTPYFLCSIFHFVLLFMKLELLIECWSFSLRTLGLVAYLVLFYILLHSIPVFLQQLPAVISPKPPS